MNQTAPNKTELARFRDLITQPHGGNTAATATLCFLSLLMIPLSQNEQLCLIYAAVTAVVLFLMSRSLGYVLHLLLPAALLYFLTGSLTLPAAFTALLLASCCGTILLTAVKDPKYFLPMALLPAAAYLAALLLTSAPFGSLLVLLPLPLAVCGTLLARRCTPHTTAVVILAAVLAVTLVAAGLLTMGAMNLLHGNPLVTLADTLRNSLTEAATALLDEMRTLYAEAEIELAITDVSIRNAVVMLVNLLPGIFLALCTVTAFLIWRTTMNLLLNLKMLPRLPLRMQIFNLSPVTAIIFLIAFFVEAVANYSSVTLVGVVAENLALVLEPGLALVGVLSVTRRDGGRRSCLSLLLLAGLVILLLYNPASALALAAFLGAAGVLLSHILPPPQSPPPTDPKR